MASTRAWHCRRQSTLDLVCTRFWSEVECPVRRASQRAGRSCRISFERWHSRKGLTPTIFVTRRRSGGRRRDAVNHDTTCCFQRLLRPTPHAKHCCGITLIHRPRRADRYSQRLRTRHLRGFARQDAFDSFHNQLRPARRASIGPSRDIASGHLLTGGSRWNDSSPPCTDDSDQAAW